MAQPSMFMTMRPSASLSCMRILALFLLAALCARADVLIVNATGIDPGFTTQEPVHVYHTIGVLTLKAPGTYTAPSWRFEGELRLGAPGNYTVVAATGSITFTRTSSISGLGAASAVPVRLTFAHAGEFVMGVGRIDTTVAVTQGPLPVIESPPLVNISTRVTLEAGQTHTAGFVVGGKVPRRILVRAIGPTLRNFGVTNPLATPTVTVSNNFVPLRANSGWGGDPLLSDTFAFVGAFPLSADSRDAATVVTLNPGSYTVQVGGGSGEVLLEIYFVD